MNAVRKTKLKPNDPRNAWGKPVTLLEISHNKRLASAKVFIDGKLAAIFNNMFDAWDLIEDGSEFLEACKQSPEYFYIHKKTGAVITNSIKQQEEIE
tara:strand:- start:54 stop:344 length:291 start_codon:yes stop_codon:yes gene_type:complete